MVNFRPQKGVALITILVIFSALVLLSVHLLHQQNIHTSRTANVVNNSKSFQYMFGAEVFAKNILSEYFEQSKDERVHRLQPWAQSPMSFPIEQNLGQLQGSVRDLNSCFNLNSLLAESGNDERLENNDQQAEDLNSKDDNAQIGAIDDRLAGEKIFSKLIEPLIADSDVNPDALTAALKDWIDEDSDPSGPDGAEDYYYTGLQVPYRTANGLLADTSELLAIKGFSAQIVQQIKDYICVLPDDSGEINVNTVDPEQAELVWVLLEDVELSAVQNALQEMPEEGYDEQSFFQTLGAGKIAKEGQGRLAFDSKYFLLRASARVKSGKTQITSLLLKQQNRFEVVARYIGD